MDLTEFRQRGKEMVDFVADYLEGIRSRRVLPDVEPGYIRSQLPDGAPETGEPWDRIFADFQDIIMPGMMHWQSPRMNAYFPVLNSPVSMLGELLASGLNSVPITWATSPACTELEIVVMNWLARMLGLPEHFLHGNKDTLGGGCIMSTASESILVSLLTARRQAIDRCRLSPGCEALSDSEINARLVAYCSDQAHCSVEKAAIIGLVPIRFVPTDERNSMGGVPLERMIDEDLARGLVPFFVCASLGTTGVCAFDSLEEIGPVCEKHQIWLHVDAAYAGSSFVCPEFRQPLRGVQHAQSFVFCPCKWLLVNVECSAFWVRDSQTLRKTLTVEPLYLKHENGRVTTDFMHWQILLSRRFRALKLWFVLRNYGVEGLQAHIRKSVRLAEHFETKIRGDPRFEIVAKQTLGLVAFRLKGENASSEALLSRVNKSGLIHMVPTSLRGQFVLRYVVSSQNTTESDVDFGYAVISDIAGQMSAEASGAQEVTRLEQPQHLPLADTPAHLAP